MFKQIKIMNHKLIIIVAVALMLRPGTAKSAHLWQEPHDWAKDTFTYDHTNSPLFSANEFSLDLGGSYTAGERGPVHLFETSITGQRGSWGGDMGVNYFFTRKLGLGLDINMPANGGNLVDSASANLIGRFPLGNSGFAPYVFGGGGRTTDRTWAWLVQAGVGMEFRFNHNLGVFTDARYFWAQRASDGLLLRAGIRLVF